MQEVTLKSEMEFLDKYLDIEQERFGDRLQVGRTIEAEALDLLVPNLVLQPLVENAVRHGIAPHPAGGRIEIGARSKGSALVIEVTDDGNGCPGEIREGGGISMTRARLERLYGSEFRFDVGNAPDRGFRVSLTIPRHTEESGESSDCG
jgi:two-component system LytT family sensor kinase